MMRVNSENEYNEHEMQLLSLSQKQRKQLQTAISALTCVELPEMITTETQLITQELVDKYNLRSARHLDHIRIDQESPSPNYLNHEILVSAQLKNNENVVTNVRKITTPSTIKLIPISKLFISNTIDKIPQQTPETPSPKLIRLQQANRFKTVTPMNWSKISIAENDVSNLIMEDEDTRSSKTSSPEITADSSGSESPIIPDEEESHENVQSDTEGSAFEISESVELDLENIIPATGIDKNIAELIRSIQSKTKYADVGTVTDAPPPCRDRAVQVNLDEKNTYEISFQSSMDEKHMNAFNEDKKYEEDEFEMMQFENEEDEEEMKLLEFIKNNVIQYNADITECQLCGIILKKYSDILTHMAAHFEPSVLCAECGHIFEPENFYGKHRCGQENDINKNNKNKKYKCPHHQCSVVTISLFELKEHINEEHVSGDGLYHCKNCNKRFRTFAELSQHFPISIECLDSAYKTYVDIRRKTPIRYRDRLRVHKINNIRILTKKSLSAKNYRKPYRGRRCTICFKYCSHEYLYKNHYRRCLSAYNQRICYETEKVLSNVRKVKDNVKEIIRPTTDELVVENYNEDEANDLASGNTSNNTEDCESLALYEAMEDEFVVENDNEAETDVLASEHSLNNTEDCESLALYEAMRDELVVENYNEDEANDLASGNTSNNTENCESLELYEIMKDELVVENDNEFETNASRNTSNNTEDCESLALYEAMRDELVVENHDEFETNVQASGNTSNDAEDWESLALYEAMRDELVVENHNEFETDVLASEHSLNNTEDYESLALYEAMGDEFLVENDNEFETDVLALEHSLNNTEDCESLALYEAMRDELVVENDNEAETNVLASEHTSSNAEESLALYEIMREAMANDIMYVEEED